MSAQLQNFEHALLTDLALVERILRELPPVEERRHALIRTDARSVDAAIARAVKLAACGTEAKLELVK